MTQYDLNLRDYWRIIRRRKWIVIVVPLVFSFLAFAMAFLQAPKPLYRATAAVRFERSLNVTGILLKDIISFSPVGDLETQASLIESFPVMSRAAKKLGLIPAEATAESIRATPAYQDAIRALPDQVEVTSVKGTSLIEIQATSPDAANAAQIANSVAEAFQEDNIATRSAQVVEARRFIEAQLVEVGRRLRESEEVLRTFQESKEVLLLPEAKVAVQRLAAQEAEHERIKREIAATEVQLRLLEERPIGDRPSGFSPDGTDPALAKLYTSLTELTVERENLLLTLRPTHPSVKGVDARISNVRVSLIQALSSKLQVLKASAAGMRNVIAGLKAQQASLPAAALETARMEREVRINERIFSLLKERLQEALIKEKEQVAEVTIVKPALVPSTPLNPPQPGAKAAVGLLIGLVLSLVLAFVVEALDTSIGAIDEVESLLGTPVLGVIPHLDVEAELSEEKGEAVTLDKATKDQYSFLVSIFAMRSRVAEAFRGLRTSLLFAILERDFKTIMVTSAAQMEGKTTVAINLAITLAQLGKKTLLVEADLRNPFVHHVFGIPKEPGLTEVVLGSSSLDEVTLGFADLMLGKAGMEGLLDSPGMDNLFILPSGYAPPNPSELLSSQGLVQVLAEARQRYEYVVLDSAPILSVADSAILGARVDGILTIVRVGHVPRAALRRAKVLLEATKTRLLGLCLTGVRAEVSPDYAAMAYYRYGYGPRTKKAQSARKSVPLEGRGKRILRGLAVAFLVLLSLTTGIWSWRSGRLISPSVSTKEIPQAVQPASVAPLTPAGGRSSQQASPPPGLGNSVHPPAPDGAASLPSLRSPEVFTLQLHLVQGKKRAGRVAETVVPGRVFIGDFETRAEAQAYGEELIRAGTIKAFKVVPLRASEP